MVIVHRQGAREAALLLFLVALVLSACDAPVVPLAEPSQAATPAPTESEGGAPQEAASPDPGTPGITRLIFWEPFALDRPQGLLLAEMVRDFELENPDLTVEIVPWSGYFGLHEAILAQLPDGELPDLAVTFPSMIAQYAASGAVVPLDPFVSDAELGLPAEELADIFGGHLESGRLPGQGRQLMAFPFSQNAIGMWVNDTLLAQAGWDHVPATWAEFEQACFDVYAATGQNCYPFVESVSTLNAWLYSRGGQPLDPSGRLSTFNGPAGIESLALLRRLIDSGLAWRPVDAYGDYLAFADGQAAFTFSSTGNSHLYVEAYQAGQRNGIPPFEWHQAMIPQDDPGRPATALYGSSFFILRGDPAGQAAAWRLIRWFSAPVQTARWSSSLEALPIRLSALDVMTDTLAAYPFVEAQVRDILPHARPEPNIAAGLEMRDIVYTAILSVTQGYLDPQVALDQAAWEVDGLLATQP